MLQYVRKNMIWVTGTDKEPSRKAEENLIKSLS